MRGGNLRHTKRVLQMTAWGRIPFKPPSRVGFCAQILGTFREDCNNLFGEGFFRWRSSIPKDDTLRRQSSFAGSNISEFPECFSWLSLTFGTMIMVVCLIGFGSAPRCSPSPFRNTHMFFLGPFSFPFFFFWGGGNKSTFFGPASAFPVHFSWRPADLYLQPLGHGLPAQPGGPSFRSHGQPPPPPPPKKTNKHQNIPKKTKAKKKRRHKWGGGWGLGEVLPEIVSWGSFQPPVTSQGCIFPLRPLPFFFLLGPDVGSTGRIPTNRRFTLSTSSFG